MAKEIERKFLVVNDNWRNDVTDSIHYIQGYFTTNKSCSIRVRVSGAEASLNIKSATLGITRTEYEYPIPFQDAKEMLENLCNKPLLEKTLIAVECENSLWKSKKMPDYATEFSPQRRLGGKLGLKKTAVLPTVIVKEEDRPPLKEWQKNSGVKIHVWHVFYDQAFGISLDEVERLIGEGLIQPTIQTFQAPGGATTKKAIYKIYYHYAYPLGEAVEEPSLVSDFVEDKNGHILPYVKFHGGKLVLREDAVKVLDSLT